MYITFLTHNFNQQIDFTTLLNNLANDHFTTDTWHMQTIFKENPTIPLTKLNNITAFLNSIATQVKEMAKSDLSKHYTTFKIPKQTGGFRTIDAPDGELYSLLLTIKLGFENVLQTLPHNAAYAYTKTRNTLKALECHKNANAKYFLKIDIKNFFGSCTEEFIYTQLNKLFPFAILTKQKKYDTILKNIIKSACYNGHLPQGTPLSPLLTNLIMIPIDYMITNRLQNYTYTRYADDMLITSPESFSFTTIINVIKNILQDTPLTIKEEKTRYGSNNGRNWNLGIMYNKENNLTIGHKKKQKLKAAIDQFLYQPNALTTAQKQQLHGQITYAKSIEPAYFSYIIRKYNEKHHKDLLFLLTH